MTELRGNGLKWEDVAARIPGRTALGCRLRYQNYLERRAEWDEEKKNKLARLYDRFRKDMWDRIGKEMAIPWRAAEAMHWQLGEEEMATRANVKAFQLHGAEDSPPLSATSATGPPPPPGPLPGRRSSTPQSSRSRRNSAASRRRGDSSRPSNVQLQLPSLSESEMSTSSSTIGTPPPIILSSASAPATNTEPMRAGFIDDPPIIGRGSSGGGYVKKEPTSPQEVRTQNVEPAPRSERSQERV